jgi:hypothetical protein
MRLGHKRKKEFIINSAYEIKSCLLRKESSTEWKIATIHILLLDSGNTSIDILYNHECLKLIREVRPISTLETLLNKIAYKMPLTIGKEKAFLQLQFSILRTGNIC